MANKIPLNVYEVIPSNYYTCSMEVKNPHSLIICVLLSLLKFIKRLLMFNWKYPYLNKIFYFEPTLNNQKSLNGTKQQLKKEDVVSCKDSSFFFPEVWVYIYSFVNIKNFLTFYYSKNKTEKELIRYFFERFFTAFGYYKVTDISLQLNKDLKVVIMANDHVPIAMCLKYLAPYYGVKTIYTQHASVNETFPSLLFDYSFLDGEESYEKYKSIGEINGKVYLSGSPRFDQIYKIRKLINKSQYGIALNSLDNIEKVWDLCNNLKQHGFDNLCLRPHPSIEKKNWDRFVNIGISLSLPSNESSFEFLNKVKVLISNESGIHLDAALLGVPSILFNFSDNIILDWYGFIKKGLITLANDYDEVLHLLSKDLEVNNTMVRYYNASHNSCMQGRIGELIGFYVQSLAYEDNTESLDNKYFDRTENNLFYIK